jgi:hypothetical protein
MEIEKKENSYKEDLKIQDNIKKKKFIKIRKFLLILIIFICFGVFLIYMYMIDTECIIDNKKENIYRVLNVGDSITRGLGLSDPK